jgi:hypothetical protein
LALYRARDSVPSRLGGKYVLVLPYEPDLTTTAALTR